MNISKVIAVYFSALSHTKTVVETIAESVGQMMQVNVETVDFTLPIHRKGIAEFAEDELVIFGTPTYAGRVPNKVLPFVRELFCGKNTPAIAVVTFGNRNFDSSLTELCEELSQNGFRVFGAGGFPCSHVFSDQIAGIRPDEKDKEILLHFAGQITQKVKEADGPMALTVPVIRQGEAVAPYYVPKGEDGQPVMFLRAKPETDRQKCDHCGICAQVCPMGSIRRDDESDVSGICIKCFACVQRCPKGAKTFTDPDLLSHIRMLEKSCLQRKEAEIYW